MSNCSLCGADADLKVGQSLCSSCDDACEKAIATHHSAEDIACLRRLVDAAFEALSSEHPSESNVDHGRKLIEAARAKAIEMGVPMPPRLT